MRDAANDFGPAPAGMTYAPDPIPRDAVPRGGRRCDRCAGTGAFVTGSCNGHPVGPGGPCYRCRGKGWQSDADRRRNAYYDAHRVVAI